MLQQRSNFFYQLPWLVASCLQDWALKQPAGRKTLSSFLLLLLVATCNPMVKQPKNLTCSWSQST
jgi:hypothetical protein